MSRVLLAAFLLRARHQNEVHADACDGDISVLMQGARSLADAWIERRWNGTSPSLEETNGRTSSYPTLPNEELIGSLKAFWHLVILAAKHAEFTGTQQQSIVDLISEKKNGIGKLKRRVSLEGDCVIGTAAPSDRTEVALTKEGEVWSDLPYLRSELFDAFLRAPPIISTNQWTNLHSCAARITAASLMDLGFYAIWAMFDALEVDDLPRTPAGGRTLLIPTVDRLGPVLAWFQYAGSYIFRACQRGASPPDQRHDDYDCRWHHAGPEFVGYLAQEAGIQRSGFSQERWSYWKTRLEMIRDRTAADLSTQDGHLLTLQIIEALAAAESNVET